jgi:outer membrane biosynthesis protein TonB
MGPVSARLPRLLALLLVVLAALPAVAGAAVPRDVRRVISDYRADGTIEPCDHTARTYGRTLDAVEDDPDAYAPDFPIAVEAARDAREEEDCTAARDEEGDEAGTGDEAGAGATPTPTPAPTAAPAPAPAAPEPTAAPQTDPVPTADAAPDAAAGATPTPAPAQEVVPDPPAPAGSGAGAAPGTPPAGTPGPGTVLTRSEAAGGSGSAPAPVVVLGGLLLAALLAGLVVLAMRRFGWGEQRLAGLRHAVGEAGYRTGGTWQSFTDWLRFGR